MEASCACRITNHIFLAYCFVIYGHVSAISSANGVYTVTVIQWEDVILNCSNYTKSERKWVFNNSTVNKYRNIQSQELKANSYITETYSLDIRNVSLELEGIYQCKVGSQVLSTYFIKVEVIPKVQLTINGVNPTISFVPVLRNERVTATCVASSARPSVNVTWFVNNENVQSSSIQNQTICPNSKDNNTFDTFSSINFQPHDETGNITCVVKGLSETGLFVHGYFQVENIHPGTDDPTTEHDKEMTSVLKSSSSDEVQLNMVFVIIPSIFIILIISFSVACVVKKLTASRKSEQPVRRQNSSLEVSPAAGIDIYGENIQLANRNVDYSRRFTLGINDSTDEISTSDPDYSILPELEGDYYSKLQDKTSKTRNINAKDMCLLLNMKMGPVYNKWMGSVIIDSDTTKSVVISTITDQTLRSKEIHWDEYVKRVLDLPSNKHLVSVVGICIDAVSLYLLHEHIVCETLDKRIQANQTADPNKPNLMTPFQVLSYVRGMLSGLELVHSYGFLHPGLTTKKILVTDEDVCKLYDICLAKDADKRVAIAKTQAVYNLNHFAPETLLRNAYTEACDVWSIGVVIWELFSGGSQPFPSTNESIKDLDKLPSPPDEWPERYQTLQNRRIFDCWEEEVSLRPSLNQLRLSFAKIADSLESSYDRPTLFVGTVEQPRDVT